MAPWKKKTGGRGGKTVHGRRRGTRKVAAFDRERRGWEEKGKKRGLPAKSGFVTTRHEGRRERCMVPSRKERPRELIGIRGPGEGA